ncbi:hypothetical protein ACHAW6_012047 [Cyclotella cf. meneghiniana]
MLRRPMLNMKADPLSTSSLPRMLLPVEDSHELVRVRKCDSNGVPVGTAHKQPAMDTHVYEVHFQDGRTNELAMNTIADALYAQCNPDGNQYVAISWNDQIKIVNSKKIVLCSTRGWKLCCEWKDCSNSECHLLHVAEFAIAVGIDNKPVFHWVTWVLKKRDQIISLVKCQSARYHKQTHKFGIELLNNLDEAFAIDKATDATVWCDAIEMEMKMCGCL